MEHLLKLSSLTPDEIIHILDVADEYKRLHKAGTDPKDLQNNVPDYMNAFDLFLLPSNFEGSPVTLVEAQGCGVPCLASTNVPGDGSVTELVHFLPLSAPFEEWAKTADSIAPGGPHADYWPTLAAAGYELKTAAHRMEQVYDKVAGEGAR